jgi:hypothetical protein
MTDRKTKQELLAALAEYRRRSETVSTSAGDDFADKVEALLSDDGEEDSR